MGRRKRHEPKYIKAPARPPAVLAVTAAILMAAAVLSIWAFMEVDKNTSDVGWNRQRTELAVSRRGPVLNITVMDHGYSINTATLLAAGRFYGNVRRAGNLIKLPPLRLCDMAAAKGRALMPRISQSVRRLPFLKAS